MERSLLIRENAKLKRENDVLRAEVEEWKQKAEEIAHINTYTCEQMNSPLKLIPGGKECPATPDAP